MKITTALATALAGAVKAQMEENGSSEGPLLAYLFAGSVPASASEALDMVTDHTQIAEISLGGDGSALVFETEANGVITKPVAAEWTGTVAFDGANDSPGALSPTFIRFVRSGEDDGRSEDDTVPRLQMTAGGPTSSAECVLSQATYTDDGVGGNSVSIDFARIAAPTGAA